MGCFDETGLFKFPFRIFLKKLKMKKLSLEIAKTVSINTKITLSEN
jgi:hypothetical protein